MLGLLSAHVFLGARQRGLARNGTLVLAYHKIGLPPRGTRDPYLYVSPREFDRQLEALQRLGNGSGSLDRLELGPPVITFDDGSVTALENGLEIMARRGVRATQFILPGLYGKHNTWDVAKGDRPDRLMDEAQVRDWIAAGHQIGSHSKTHQNLRHLKPQDAWEEIAGSKKQIEDKFGLPVRHFSYPYGSWNPALREMVREAGYATACTMRFGVNAAQTPPLELRRIIPLSSGELLGKIAHRLRRRLLVFSSKPAS